MHEVIAESEHYRVVSVYEECRLEFKTEDRPYVRIGDFYGDAEFALIDRNEKFVVTGGCGVVIYRLQEPFDDFTSKKKPDQAILMGFDEPIYYDSVEQISDNAVKLIDADGGETVVEGIIVE